MTLGGVKTSSLSADTFSATRSLSASQPAESGLSLIALVLDEEFSFERSLNLISFVTSMLVMVKLSCGSFTNKRYVSNNVKDASVRSKISLFCGVHNVTAVNSVAFTSKESTSTVHRQKEFHSIVARPSLQQRSKLTEVALSRKETAIDATKVESR